MTDITMFEQASRLQLRFDSAKGQLTVEDLWRKDIPLTSTTGKVNLDDIAKGLHRQLKDIDDVSFVTPSARKDKGLQLKFDIVKYIIDVRVAERDAATEAVGRSEKKQQILSIIALKEVDALATTSIEDLRKMAAEL